MRCPPNLASLAGVNQVGTNRTPGIWRAFRYCANTRGLIHGAPNTSNGVSVPRPTDTFVYSKIPIPVYSANVSVPRPTDTFVYSKIPIPVYSAASFIFRIFGDRLIQTRSVESNQSLRVHPFTGTTLSLALMWRSLLNIFANSPTVMPWRIGSLV